MHPHFSKGQRKKTTHGSHHPKTDTSRATNCSCGGSSTLEGNSWSTRGFLHVLYVVGHKLYRGCVTRRRRHGPPDGLFPPNRLIHPDPKGRLVSSEATIGRSRSWWLCKGGPRVHNKCYRNSFLSLATCCEIVQRKLPHSRLLNISSVLYLICASTPSARFSLLCDICRTPTVNGVGYMISIRFLDRHRRDSI